MREADFLLTGAIVVASILLGRIAWLVIARRTASRDGHLLVGHAMTRRGITHEALQRTDLEHKLDEAAGQCAHCGDQRACARQLSSAQFQEPDSCPNHGLFEQLSERAHPATMHRYEVDSKPRAHRHPAQSGQRATDRGTIAG